MTLPRIMDAQCLLVDAILNQTPYPVTTLVVQSGNPAVTMADSARVEKALEKLDFLVVIDPFFTRTDDFNTPSGKVEFYSKRLDQAGHQPTPYMDGRRENPISFVAHGLEDPLVGIRGDRENRFTHSQFHHVAGLLKDQETPVVGFHPDDAAKRSIRPGDLVRVSTPRGEIRMPAAYSSPGAGGRCTRNTT